MREYVVENEFVKAVRKAGGVAYKLTMKSTLCIEKQIFLYNPGMYLEIAAERPVSIVEGARLLRLEEVVPATTEVSEHDKTICAALVMDSMVKGPC